MTTCRRRIKSQIVLASSRSRAECLCHDGSKKQRKRGSQKCSKTACAGLTSACKSVGASNIATIESKSTALTTETTSTAKLAIRNELAALALPIITIHCRCDWTIVAHAQGRINATTTTPFTSGIVVDAGEVAATNAWTGHPFGGPSHQYFLASGADTFVEFVPLHA